MGVLDSQLSVKNVVISQLSVNFDRSHFQLPVKILVISQLTFKILANSQLSVKPHQGPLLTVKFSFSI